jgi:hypothetical protein
MIKKINIPIILVIVLTVLNLYLLLKVHVLQNTSCDDLQQGYDLLTENYNNLFKKDYFESIDQNTTLSDTIRLRDKSGGVLPLKSILPTDNHYKFVIRVSQENCFTCFEKAFKMINSYTSKISSPDVLYLGHYAELTTMTTFIRSNLGKNAAGLNLESPLNLKVDKLELPYLFVLDQNGRVHNVYVITKQNQKQVDRYMSEILKKYFNVHPVK